MPDRHTIKSGTVAINVVRHPPHGWRFAWKDESGKWRYVHRKSLATAKAAAKSKAQQLAQGKLPLSSIPPEKAEVLRRILAYDFGIDQLREFETWLSDRAEKRRSVEEAGIEFLKAKDPEGEGGRNFETLLWVVRQFTARFAQLKIDEVKAEMIEAWLSGVGAPRTRLNLRRGIVTLFRWCRDRGYLPDSIRTEVEKTAVPKVTKKTPETYSPAQLKKMLDGVRPQYLGWLVCGAFLGLRSSEILRLRWEDFRWREMLLIVPAEITKTNERRVIPIPDVTLEWVPDPPNSGLVCPSRPHQVNRGDVAETKRMGDLVGGWKQNGLRHSWTSYRCAIVGVAETAMEAGNSEAMIRRNYRDAKSKAEAESWFGVRT